MICANSPGNNLYRGKWKFKTAELTNENCWLNLSFWPKHWPNVSANSSTQFYNYLRNSGGICINSLLFTNFQYFSQFCIKRVIDMQCLLQRDRTMVLFQCVSEYGRYRRTLINLEAVGFRRWFYHIDFTCKYTRCVTAVYVNSKFRENKTEAQM